MSPPEMNSSSELQYCTRTYSNSHVQYTCISHHDDALLFTTTVIQNGNSTLDTNGNRCMHAEITWYMLHFIHVCTCCLNLLYNVCSYKASSSDDE